MDERRRAQAVADDVGRDNSEHFARVRTVGVELVKVLNPYAVDVIGFPGVTSRDEDDGGCRSSWGIDTEVGFEEEDCKILF
jgi:hypothetical protein